MLIQFSVGNYSAIKDKITLSLVASNYDKYREGDNTIKSNKFGLKLLKSAVIYGANASGKTKLLESFGFFKHFIVSSSKESQANEKIETTPFKLDNKSEKQPSFFEIVFIDKDSLYKYGFEVDNKEVKAEWLYQRSNTKDVEVFHRKKQNFDIHENFKVGRNLVRDEMVRNNALLLSVGAQFNDVIAKKILKWLNSVALISGVKEEGYENFTIAQVQNEKSKQKILSFIKYADLGIEDFEVEELDYDNLPKDMPKKLRDLILSQKERPTLVNDVKTFHKKYDGNNQLTGLTSLSMIDDESSGTRKYFAIAGPIIDTLERGDVLFIDELDAKLHPVLVYNIVALFNSRITNPKNAQLIFNTHDTNLLSSDVFRRDQIWFTEKDKYGAVDLYSLSDIKTKDNAKIRNDENYERNYIQGKYGAIPYVGDFTRLLLK